MKKLHITKENFIEWYFNTGADDEQKDARYNLGEKVINSLTEGKIFSFSVEDAFNECEMECVSLDYIEEYKKGYNVKYMGKLMVNGVNSDYIKLTPTSKNGIQEVNLFVNAAKKQIVKVEQFSTDKSVSVIAISDYKENQNLSSALFNFDKDQYKNYLVTEL